MGVSPDSTHTHRRLHALREVGGKFRMRDLDSTCVRVHFHHITEVHLPMEQAASALSITWCGAFSFVVLHAMILRYRHRPRRDFYRCYWNRCPCMARRSFV